MPGESSKSDAKYGICREAIYGESCVSIIFAGKANERDQALRETRKKPTELAT